MSSSGCRLGITLGDPGGIGPEIALKAVYESEKDFIPVVFGPISVMDYLPAFLEWFDIHFLAMPKNGERFKGLRWSLSTAEGLDPVPSSAAKKKLFWVNTGDTPFQIGAVAAGNGHHAYTAIQWATEACLSGDLDGMVTAPICKEAMALAGAPLTDHTTLLASLAKSDVSMGFYSGPLRVVLVSVHCALSEVHRHITPETIRRACHHAFALAQYHRQSVSKNNPIRIAVAGLNPHAGENGLFGDEERLVIAPVVAALREEGLPVEGPFPADTLFHYAYKGDFDVVVAMYHDQGLIPVKMVAFDTAVNVTLGLPFIRTSPDHGTAFALAYQGKATHTSFDAALSLALSWRR